MIAKSARDGQRFQRETFFFDSAREGMAAYLASDRLSRLGLRSILLPAFIGYSEREGSGVFDPVRASGLEPSFYDVAADLTADIGSLRSALNAASGKSVVVLIHYFGRTDPMVEEVRAVCTEHGALLLEDLAHALFTYVLGAPAGRACDAAIFSLHKMLPTPDGGMLVVRGGAADVRSTRPAHASTVLGFDHALIAERRRRNYRLMQRGLVQLAQEGIPCRPLWKEIGARDVPQTLPIVVPDELRNDFYSWMNDRGAGVVSLYHTLIPDLPPGFENARRLARTITNLPVHQDMDDADARAVVALTAAFFRRSRL